jgi:hypothetical protein
MQITTNMSFGVCNIWVILGHAISLKKTKGERICNSSNANISRNVDSKKIDQDEIFYKGISHFFVE